MTRSHEASLLPTCHLKHINCNQHICGVNVMLFYNASSSRLLSRYQNRVTGGG
jgi:hypothetical protein